MLAGQAPEFFVVQVINTAEEAAEFVLEGLPDGEYELIAFTEAGWVQSQGTVAASGGTVTVDMAPESVLFVVSQ